MERVLAVALLIVSPAGRIFCLEELQDKVQYEKYSGMISFPIETIEDGEDREHALERLLREEVGSFLFLSDPDFLGEVDMDFSTGRKSRIFCYSVLSPEEFREIRQIQIYDFLDGRVLKRLFLLVKTPVDERCFRFFGCSNHGKANDVLLWRTGFFRAFSYFNDSSFACLGECSFVGGWLETIKHRDVFERLLDIIFCKFRNLICESAGNVYRMRSGE